MPAKTKICPVCNNEFIIPKRLRGREQVYCNSTCRAKQHNIAVRKEMPQHPKRTCFCGTEFISHDWQQKYCSSRCRSKHNSRRWVKNNKELARIRGKQYMRVKRGIVFDMKLMKEVQVDNAFQLPTGEFEFSQGQESLGLVSRNRDREDDSGT